MILGFGTAEGVISRKSFDTDLIELFHLRRQTKEDFIYFSIDNFQVYNCLETQSNILYHLICLHICILHICILHICILVRNILFLSHKNQYFMLRIHSNDHSPYSLS
jgi:hypothetical protein